MDTTEEHHNWKRMRFKRNKVYVAVDDREDPIVRKDKVLIKYQLDQSHQYWVHQNKIYPLDHPVPPPKPVDDPVAATKPTAKKPNSDASDAGVTPLAVCPEISDRTICIHTDGACSGNPGPAGIGVVMQYQQHQKEISQYIGTATNNIAELTAIKVALESVKNTHLPVVIYTDSSYALGLLTKGWKPIKNAQLVHQTRNLTKKFKDLKFYKVKGHAGNPGNERADHLAVEAIKRKSSSGISAT